MRVPGDQGGNPSFAADGRRDERVSPSVVPKGNMLPRRHRLRRHRDVTRASRARTSAHGSFFTARSYGRRDEAPSRFAFVVSRKVSKNATERNRIARQARSIVAAALPRILPGHDVVIIARSPFPPYDREAATAELSHLFQRLHLSSP